MPPNGTQSLFGAALLAREAPPAALRLVGEAEARDRRFSIHRNTMFGSLVAVLTARFPAVSALVGEDFFRGVAAEFVAAHPPVSPVLLEYGSGFSAFIAAFGPAQDLPYLADVAAFEWLRHDALHAADAEPVSLDVLTSIEPTRLDDVRFTLHPAARVFASDYPAARLWRIAIEGVAAPNAVSGPDYALIARPDLSVHVHDLTAGPHAFLAAIADGDPFGEAVAAGQRAQSGFDLAGTLALVFSAGAITAVTHP